MPVKKKDRGNVDLDGFFEIAKKLFQDGALVKRLRKAQGLSKSQAAKNGKTSVSKVEEYERPGPVRGNFWLFCYYLRGNVVDPRLIGDKGYLDETLEIDPESPRKEGKIGDRDPWYEWSGKKYKKFHRWAHRKYIEKMTDDERKKAVPRKKVKEWHDEWVRLGKPDASEVITD